jgi:hypothetical protein
VILEKKPAAAKKPAATRKPAVVKKPVVARKPVVAAEPAMRTKSVAAEKPVVATKPAVAKKPAAPKKVAAKKETPAPPVILLVQAPGKSTVKPSVKSTVRSKKLVTTATSRGAKLAERPAVEAMKKPAVRSRRQQSAVLEVSRSIIDKSSAAEVAARLVVDGHGVANAHLGNIFTPPPAVAVKRGSSALRHVKEMLNRPVARQLDGVFGPPPVPTATLRRFLKGEKVARNQRIRGSTNFHSGQPGVGHRSVG